MKVFQINTTCGTGSTGRIAADIYRALKDAGHDCKIAYGRGKARDVPADDAIKTGLFFSVCIHAALARIIDRAGFFSRRATRKLIKKIAAYNPDIIHLHNLHGYYLNIRVLFRFLSQYNKPVVWTQHDCWPLTGHCCHFSAAGCDRWRNGCYACRQKREYPSSLLLDRSRKNYEDKKALFTSLKNTTLITPSEWLAGIVRQSFLNCYPVNVIPNGIDLDQFKPTKSSFRKDYRLEDRPIVLGVSAQWDKNKGLKDLVGLAGTLDGIYKVVIVGLNKAQMRSLPENIQGIRHTSNAVRLAEIYTAADIFVNPSIEETMGLVTVEAMACGTPVIVYNKTAVPEAVDEKCGFVVEPENGIGRMCDIISKKLYNMIPSKDCVDHAAKFNKETMSDGYLQLYYALLTPCSEG